MSKVKILYVLTRCLKSGPVNVLANIIKNLDKNVFDVFVITINEENPKRSILTQFCEGYTHFYVPVSKKDALLGRCAGLKKKIDEIAPDVIHTTGVVPDLLISRMYPKKQITIVHCNVDADYTYCYGKIKGKMLAEFHKHLYKKIGDVICCSKSLSEYYSGQGLALPFIRNGVECPRDTGSDKTEMRNSLHLPQNAKLYLYAASFNGRKNHIFLAEQFKKYASDDRVLVLLGDGPTYAALKSEYSNYDSILFIGRVNNVAEYIQACDYFVSSSRQEGMPMGVLEAMAGGLPVLLTDIPQHKEIFEANPHIGKTYRLNDERDFQNALAELEGMNYDFMSSESKKIVNEEFSDIQMGKKYQIEYLKISNDKSEGPARK